MIPQKSEKSGCWCCCCCCCACCCACCCTCCCCTCCCCCNNWATSSLRDFLRGGGAPASSPDDSPDEARLIFNKRRLDYKLKKRPNTTTQQKNRIYSGKKKVFCKKNPHPYNKSNVFFTIIIIICDCQVTLEQEKEISSVLRHKEPNIFGLVVFRGFANGRTNLDFTEFPRIFLDFTESSEFSCVVLNLLGFTRTTKF